MILIRLKEVAEAQGKTKRNLVDETGLGYGTVLNLWRANVSGIDLKTLDALCRALHVQPGELLVWRGPAESGKPLEEGGAGR